MVQATLKLWGNFSVEIETTEVLTPEEKTIVTEGLQNAFCWIFLDDMPLPTGKEIRDNIDRLGPNISQKLRRVYRH